MRRSLGMLTVAWGLVWVAHRAPTGVEAAVAPALAAAPQVHDAAPDFALVDTYGDKVHLSDFRGKIVVLHFWAEWCASCKVDLAYFQQAWETFQSDDVVVLGLAYASGSRDDVAEFLDALDITFPTVICDEATRAAYDVASLPTNFIVDRDGNIRHVARRLMNGAYWDEILQELIAE